MFFFLFFKKIFSFVFALFEDVTLALLDVENIDDSLKSICAIVNDVQNEGSAYWFVPDLTSVDSWEGNEEHLKAYTDKIEQPMSFTQVKAQIEDGTLDSEEKVVEAVMLIFKNAKEFNEEGSECFDNALNLENHFKERLANLVSSTYEHVSYRKSNLVEDLQKI